jgi:hypothetical protein
MWSFPSFFPDIPQPAGIKHSLNLHWQRGRAFDDPQPNAAYRNRCID